MAFPELYYHLPFNLDKPLKVFFLFPESPPSTFFGACIRGRPEIGDLCKHQPRADQLPKHEVKPEMAVKYQDSAGKDRIKGGKDLKSSQSYPLWLLGLKVVVCHLLFVSWFILKSPPFKWSRPTLVETFWNHRQPTLLEMNNSNISKWIVNQQGSSFRSALMIISCVPTQSIIRCYQAVRIELQVFPASSSWIRPSAHMLPLLCSWGSAEAYLDFAASTVIGWHRMPRKRSRRTWRSFHPNKSGRGLLLAQNGLLGQTWPQSWIVSRA